LDDKELNVTNLGNGEFELKDFKVQKLGRFIIRLKISDEKNNTKFFDIYCYKEK